MKTKLFKTLAATAMSVLAIACAKEPVADNGQQAGVSFEIENPVVISKAGEGITATQLYYQVFTADGQLIAGLPAQSKTLTSLKTTVTFQLVKDQTYKFIFWAQTPTAGYYSFAGTDDAKDIRTITANYEGKEANDENFDAFFATESFKVTGPVTKTVTLKRPFAQINIGTKDQLKAGDATAPAIDFGGAKSSVTVKGVPTVFSPLAATPETMLTIPETVTFASAAIPTGQLKVNETDYDYLAMNYVFAPAEGTVCDLSAEIVLTGREPIQLSSPTTPIQRNWRTNILGSLLTSSVDFDVVVDPSFGGNEDIDLVNIKNEASLKALFANGGTAKLASDFTVSEPIVLEGKKVVNLNLNGKTLTFNGGVDDEHCCMFRVHEGTLTIYGNGNINGGGDAHNQRVMFLAKGTDAHIVINNGNFKMGKTTSAASDWYDCVYASAGGRIDIHGGTFETEATRPNGKHYILNLNNGNPGTITVDGGKFVNCDPAQGDDHLGGNFVADGYKSTKVGDYYVVTKKDVTPVANNAGLNTAISGEGTSKDTPITVELTSNTTVTLDNGIANEGENSRNITFVGDGTQTVDVITKATNAEGGMLNYQRGSSFTFKNMTIQAGEGSFDGVVCDALTYENCTIKGKLTLYGKATFVNCVFENTMADQYCIWTWGGTDVKFDGCTFNTNGKAILLYGQATEAKPTNLMVVNSIFNDRNNGSAGKAAIEIGNDYNAYYKLTIDGCTVNGFADGKNTGSKLWANKNSMDAAHLSVTIDGTPVL